MVYMYPEDKCVTVSPNLAGVYLVLVNLELNVYPESVANKVLKGPVH